MNPMGDQINTAGYANTTQIESHNHWQNLTLATVAMHCSNIRDENLSRIASITKEIKQANPAVDLVFMGETLFSWYSPAQHPDIHYHSSEPIPGPITERISSLCKDLGIYMCFGMVEKYADHYFNAQVVIDPDGKIIAVHRKWNLKTNTFTPGNEPFITIKIKGIRISILICADAAHPHTMLQLIKTKPDLILLSLADDKDDNFFMSRFNAKLYCRWIATANRVGFEDDHYWSGHIVISNPQGRLLKYSRGCEGWLFQEITEIRYRNPLLHYLQHLISRISLIFLILKNWKIARSYFS